MAQKRLAMRKIKEILRLSMQGGMSSRRQIGRALGLSKSAAGECLQRAHTAGLSEWSQVEGLDEASLERLLYPRSKAGPRRARVEPDWNYIRQELARRDHQITLALLWSEYKREHPEGYAYSQFTDLYRRHIGKLSVVMRQAHRAGEKCFVDFCDGITLRDGDNGQPIATQLFVGTLGASSYTFAYATTSQSLPVWLDCHARMYAAFGGVPTITVPDNLGAAVSKADRYEPELNRSYQELAQHYGTCVIPARVRRPRDKAKVEAAVLVAQRWILAALRHRSFYSLEALNAVIAELTQKLNAREMRHVKQSRWDLYERVDRPALKQLPATPYEYAQWAQARLNIDYHLSFEDHFYSAPYHLIHEMLWVRASAHTVELFHQGLRVASHPRSNCKYAYSTQIEHRPASHQAHLQWTPERLIQWGQRLGPSVGLLIQHVISSKPHPEQGYRSALGILRLSHKVGPERLEQACVKALAIRSPHYKTIKTMLARHMETAPARDQHTESPQSTDTLGASNVRGSKYYH